MAFLAERINFVYMSGNAIHLQCENLVMFSLGCAFKSWRLAVSLQTQVSLTFSCWREHDILWSVE